MKKYIVEQFGDISGRDTFNSLVEALLFVEKICIELATEDCDDIQEWINNGGLPYCDTEDNRITITEINGGIKKVVWHFSGWHWDSEEFGIPQGKLLGHQKSLYEESSI